MYRGHRFSCICGISWENTKHLQKRTKGREINLKRRFIFKASLSSFIDLGARKKSDSKSVPAGAGVGTGHQAQLAHTPTGLAFPTSGYSTGLKTQTEWDMKELGIKSTRFFKNSGPARLIGALEQRKPLYLSWTNPILSVKVFQLHPGLRAAPEWASGKSQTDSAMLPLLRSKLHLKM